MKVKILRSWCLGKGIDTVIGDTIDLPEREAKIKIYQGKARSIHTPEKSKKARAQQAAAYPTLYQLDEALNLIAKAETVEAIDEIMTGDTREETCNAAAAKKDELKGGSDNEK